MKGTTKRKKQETIDEMLTAINKDEVTGLYYILRVVAAHPLVADFNSKSAEVKDALREDKHALGQLPRQALTSALASTPDDRSILSKLTIALKRTREEDDEGEAGQPNRKAKRRDGKVGDGAKAGQATQKSTGRRGGVGDDAKPGQPSQKSRRKNEIETAQSPRRSTRTHKK